MHAYQAMQCRQPSFAEHVARSHASSESFFSCRFLLSTKSMNTAAFAASRVLRAFERIGRSRQLWAKNSPESRSTPHHPRLSTLVGSPTYSFLYSAIAAAIAFTSRPTFAERSCLITVPRPSFHLLWSSGEWAGALCVPSNLSSSLSVTLVVLGQLPNSA